MREGLVMVCDVDLGVPDATRTHTVEVARGFAAEGLAVDLVTRGPDPQVPGVDYAPAKGGEHDRITRLWSLNAVVLSLLWRRRRTARRLYVRHRWSLMPVMLAGRLLGYSVVTQVDDVPYGRNYEYEGPRLLDYCQRLCTVAMGRLASGVVAVTPEIKRLLVDEFHVPSSRVAVLPNGVDIDLFQPSAREEAIGRVGLDPGLRYAVFCGRFAAWVDFDTMLEAFAGVARERPDARLLLVGDGDQRARIEELAAKLQIKDAVLITGFIEDRGAVRDYVSAGTLAVASHQTGYMARVGVSPTKLAEYLALGRAVVVKDVPGMREAVEAPGAGIVVNDDPEEMARAILALLDPDRADAMGVNGRRVAEERFSWRSTVRGTLPLFALSG